MYEMDQSWEGFEWINADDGYRSIYSFMRHSKVQRRICCSSATYADGKR